MLEHSQLYSGVECNHNTEYEIEYGGSLSNPIAICNDKPGSCKRNLCDCVVSFAKHIAQGYYQNISIILPTSNDKLLFLT